MGYLKNYKHDIFVSYAHREIEKEEYNKKLTSWTERVVNLLRMIIADYLMGEDSGKLDIFIDTENIEIDRELTQSLREEVNNSGLLLVFISEAYLKRRRGDKPSWGQFELQTFLEKKRWPYDPSRHGVFIIEAQRTNREKDWPEGLKDREGTPHVYCILHDEEEVSMPLPIDKENKLFTSRLYKLAGAICESLKSLSDYDKPSTDSERITRNKVIYLACGANNSVRKDRRLLEGKLREKEKHIDIVPQMAFKDLLKSQDFFEKQVDIDLRASHCFVQILGDENGQYDLTEFQHKRAEALNLPIYHWKKPDLSEQNVDEEDQSYVQFAKEHFPRADTNSIDKFADKVIKELPKKIEEEPVGVTTWNKPQVFVYAVDRSGYRFVRKELTPHLPDVIREAGYFINCPTEDADTKVIEDFRESLPKKCDVLILVHTPKQEQRVLDVLYEFASKITYENPGKEFFVGIIESPPGMVVEVPTDDIKVFDCKDKTIKSDLREWLESIKKVITSTHRANP